MPPAMLRHLLSRKLSMAPAAWPSAAAPWTPASATAVSATACRCATPISLRTAAVWLASDLSSAVTGEVVYVDGGFNVLGVPLAED